MLTPTTYKCYYLSVGSISDLIFSFFFFREKEADLETRYRLLNEELHKIASIEDWRKTEDQRNREQILLDELVQIVNKRDELVHHLDNQEKA